MDNLGEEIRNRLLEADLSGEKLEGAARFGELLLKMNTQVNLTGAKDASELVNKHILDTYLAVQAITGREWPKQIWDIGAGGGIPGLLLAIFRPELKVNLVERRQRKGLALKSLVDSLGLEGRVTVSISSFELMKPLPKDCGFWFRGFLPGPKLIQFLSDHFHSEELGTLYLMKGPAWAQEKKDALAIRKIKPLWRQRFEGSIELHYALPLNLGSRSLVLI